MNDVLTIVNGTSITGDQSIDIDIGRKSLRVNNLLSSRQYRNRFLRKSLKILISQSPYFIMEIILIHLMSTGGGLTN